MTITTTKLVDDDFKIIVNSNGVGGEFQQKLVDVVGSNNATSEPKVSIANMQYEILGDGNVTVYFKNDTTKKVEVSGRGNYGLKPDEIKVKDAIGDIVVVLTNLATLNNFTIEECIESAYNEIKNRKGKIVNGSFKKN